MNFGVPASKRGYPGHSQSLRIQGEGGSISHTKVAIDFKDERFELDVPEGRLVAAWRGPDGIPASEVSARVSSALDSPRDFPSLRLAVVPGDRIVVALGPDVPEAGVVLDALCKVLIQSGIEPESVTILADPNAPEELARAVPQGVEYQRHDPENRKQLAYLATTTGGRRVYLNRLLTDADFVVPVGRIAYDPALGYRGPWSVVFPGCSDTETRAAVNSEAGGAPPDPLQPPAWLTESNEVSWLLGSQFQLGILAGVSGLVDVFAGANKSVLDQGTRELDRAWKVRVEGRAELVVAGVGRPGEPTRIDHVANGLATAMKLVQRGGKIVVLSRAEGPIGPAVQRLVGLDDPRDASAALKGHEADSDYTTALQLSRALAWADVYVLSELGRDAVEDLSMIALDRPEEARRLAAVSGSSLVVSQADLATASVADDAE